MDPDEYEELDAMLRSHGWAHFEQAVRQECTDALRQVAVDPKSTVALEELRWVLVRREAKLAALAWPKERMATLERRRAQRAPADTCSRRGTL